MKAISTLSLALLIGAGLMLGCPRSEDPQGDQSDDTSGDASTDNADADSNGATDANDANDASTNSANSGSVANNTTDTMANGDAATSVNVESALPEDHPDYQKSEHSNPVLGNKAPDFTLTDANGNQHTLSDYAGKVVVLEWINYDCPYVKKHYQESGLMPQRQAKWREQGVVWLTICSSAAGKQGNFTGDTLMERIEMEGGNADSYLIDDTSSVGRDYHAATTPHMFVINKAGVVQYTGAIDDWRETKDVTTATCYVDQALMAIMAGEPVRVPETKPYGCGTVSKFAPAN